MAIYMMMWTKMVGLTVQLRVLYDNESHFVVETDIGDVRIRELLFSARITITKRKFH